jgi:biopolymer transport protein ExbD
MSRRIGRLKIGEQYSEPTVNLTPLIDVVFVILIMFIVIAPLLQLEEIDLAAAAQQTTNQMIPVQEASPIAIHVQRDNSIVFGGNRVTIQQLTQSLREAKSRYPEARLQLFHDKVAQFGTYQSVKNAAEEAGFSSLDLILKPG